MIELRVHDRRPIPEEHAVTVGRAALANVLRRHARDAVEGVRSVGARSVCKTHRADGHSIDVVLVCPGGEVAETILDQHLRIAGVRRPRSGCLLQLALQIQSGKTLRQQRSGHRGGNHLLRRRSRLRRER